MCGGEGGLLPLLLAPPIPCPKDAGRIALVGGLGDELGLTEQLSPFSLPAVFGICLPAPSPPQSLCSSTTTCATHCFPHSAFKKTAIIECLLCAGLFSVLWILQRKSLPLRSSPLERETDNEQSHRYRDAPQGQAVLRTVGQNEARQRAGVTRRA